MKDALRLAQFFIALGAVAALAFGTIGLTGYLIASAVVLGLSWWTAPAR